jgi:hypothetical protein
MKYIMAEASTGSIRRKIPCVFPAFLVHSEVARTFKHALARHGYEDIAFISAGEVTFFGTGIQCHGKSETLNVTAEDGDGRVIEMYDYLGGV